MSGPKRADVVAQLNIARNSQRTCARLISSAQDAAIAGIVCDADGVLGEAGSLSGQLRDELTELNGDMRRVSSDGVSSLEGALAGGDVLLASARQALEEARDEVDQARGREEAARASFEAAEKEFERAAAALQGAGGHYMHNEMAWARQATSLYDRAAKELRAATEARKRAGNKAAESLRQACEGRGCLVGALHRAGRVREEAHSLLRAEEEAKLIGEEKRRQASFALEKAGAAVLRVEMLPHDKFSPGRLLCLKRDLTAARAGFSEGGAPDEAKMAAERVVASTVGLEHEVLAAQREFERCRASAESKVEVLRANLTGMDENLIRQWSSAPDACDRARGAVKSAVEAITTERFQEAEEICDVSCRQLTQSLENAAEAKAANERRTHIGGVIMEVLQELNFDVSYEPGSKDKPMRISGQTPDVSGKGDFDVAIPLSGEVDFLVEAPEGDLSCVGAVDELQKRLAERGIQWTTTDWGNAKAGKMVATENNVAQVKTVVKKKG